MSKPAPRDKLLASLKKQYAEWEKRNLIGRYRGLTLSAYQVKRIIARLEK